MNLSLLFLLPALTAIAILLTRSIAQSRLVALLGATAQLGLVGLLMAEYFSASSGQVLATGEFLFQQRISWFPALHIDYFVGVDGIAVAMIGLTALVVFAGVLVSWQVKKLSTEFFFLLLLLSAGAYGFFISLDLFHQFIFLELAVIPKY